MKTNGVAAQRHLAGRHRSIWILLPIWSVTFYGLARCIYIALIQRSFGPTPFDELLCLILLPYAVMGFLYEKLYRYAFGFIIFSVGYLFFSFLGFIVYGHFIGIRAKDALFGLALDTKFYILFFSFIALFCRNFIRPNDYIRILKFILIISIINTLFIAHDIFSGQDIYGGRLMVRNGYSLPNGLFGHKTSSAQVQLLGYIAALSLSLYGNRILYIILAAANVVLLFLHQGSKEIIAAIIVSLVYTLFLKNSRLVQVLIIIVISTSAPVLIFSGQDSVEEVGFISRIQYYLSDQGIDSARRILWDTAVVIAQDHFPLGTGAGSFASEPSRGSNFSPVYYMYGISGAGMTEEDASYLLDNYWAKILGESGIVGMFCSVMFVALILKKMFYVIIWSEVKNKAQRIDVTADCFSTAMVLAAIVCSFGSSIFASEVMAMPFAFSAGYLAWRGAHGSRQYRKPHRLRGVQQPWRPMRFMAS